MKNIFIFIAFLYLFLIPNGVKAQYKWQYGVSIGTMKYDGDVGASPGNGFSNVFNSGSKSYSSLSFHFGYRPLELFNLGISSTIGQIGADDGKIAGTSASAIARRTRNINFKSIIAEVTLMGEVYPTIIFEKEPRSVEGKIRPYITAGIGFFHFNPKGEYITPAGSAVWVPLQPLRTEGQGMPSHPNRKEYSLNQKNTPAGFGLKYFVNHRMSLSMEVIVRKTNTDYLDDVSTTYIDNNDFSNFFGAGSPMAQIAIQMANNPAYKNGGVYLPGYGVDGLRGSPKYNDFYYATSIKLLYRFGKNEGFENIKYSNGNSVRCPKF